MLMHDQQIRFEGNRQIVYNHTVVMILSPQGLAVGNLSFAWRPETDRLIVHGLKIHRGSETIDVLASGQTFTVLRRETNLERATLDGVLTANIQPEGLRVGDILDFSSSIESADPVFRGHAEHVNVLWNGSAIDLARYRISWPESTNVRLAATAGTALPAPRRSGGFRTIDLLRRNVLPITFPQGSPGRFQIGRLIEATDYTTWSELATLMAPLYVQASQLSDDSPLNAEIERIRSADGDQIRMASGALMLVQDRVRYVALSMGEGGYVPADADQTWSRRYGDCKGKTALLLALLHRLGIEADAVLVNSNGSDGLDQRLPLVQYFNHVIIRAIINGHSYWLDGTRTGDRGIERIEVPAYVWGLPVVDSAAALVPIMPEPMTEPNERLSVIFDVGQDRSVPSPVTAEILLTGDAAVGVNAAISAIDPSQRDAAWREYWRTRVHDANVTESSFDFDPELRTIHMTMSGTAPMEWNNNAYRPFGGYVGYRAEFERPAGQDASVPYAVGFPIYQQTETVLRLPGGGRGFIIVGEQNVDETVAGTVYQRSARIEDGVFRLTNTTRTLTSEFPASEAVAAQARLRQMSDNGLYIRAPRSFGLDAQGQIPVTATQPQTAEAFMYRAGTLFENDQFDSGMADLARAHELEPLNAGPLGMRAFARMGRADFTGAKADIEAALLLAPNEPSLLMLAGRIAMQGGHASDAIGLLTRAIALDPANSFQALAARSEAYRNTGDLAHALEDIDAVIALNNDSADVFLTRANILRQMGRHAEASAVATDVVTANPNDAFSWVISARIHDRFGNREAARAAFDRAIAIEPAGYIYLNRSFTLPASDVSGRLADVQRAMALDPDVDGGWTEMARLQHLSGDVNGAVISLTTAIAQNSDDPDTLAQRGMLYAQTNRAALAARDFDAARALATTAMRLNSLCWEKTLAGIALDRALEECNAAVALSPRSAGIIDSLGWAYVRLNRPEEAIETFTRALLIAPQQAASLYGRAFAWRQLGDMTRASADRDAALVIAANIADEFDRHGIAWEAAKP
jgi:tetratricopeptide (TPR) repeat protein